MHVDHLYVFLKTSFMKINVIYLMLCHFQCYIKPERKGHLTKTFVFCFCFVLFSGKTMEKKEKNSCSLYLLLGIPLSYFLNSLNSFQCLPGGLLPWKFPETLSQTTPNAALLHWSSTMSRFFLAIHTFWLNGQKWVTVGKWLCLSIMQNAIAPFCVEVQRIHRDGFVTKVSRTLTAKWHSPLLS